MQAAALQLELAEYFTGPKAIARGTDDMYIPTTQIRIVPDGAWHKRGPIPTETACGLPYAAAAAREYTLTSSRELCGCCHTPRERWLADHPEELTS